MRRQKLDKNYYRVGGKTLGPGLKYKVGVHSTG